MTLSKDDLKAQFLRNRAIALTEGLMQRFEEIVVSDFPTGQPKRIIELLENILTQLQKEFHKTSDESELKLFCNLIQGLGVTLKHFDNANTEQTPRGLVLLLESITCSLNPKTKLIAWPQAEYNYSIIDILDGFKCATETVFSKAIHDDLFKSFDGALNLISFPRIERDNILLHTVFGHEIGHSIADEFLTEEKGTQVYADGLADLSKKILAHIDLNNHLDPVKKLQQQGRLIALAIDARERGLEELISDCVCAQIFGPNALFALYYFLIDEEPDAPPIYPLFYPPARYRIRIVKELLDNSGATELLKNLEKLEINKSIAGPMRSFIEIIEDHTISDLDKQALDSNIIIKESYEWLEKSLPKAIEFAKNRVGEILFENKLIEEEVPMLIERLELNLPPNEIGIFPDIKVANWRAALLSAWLYKISNDFDSDSSYSGMPFDQLQKLTLVSIEYILLSNDYNNFISS